MNLEITIIRMLWNLVETSNPYSLVKLSDKELKQQLIEQIEKIFLLSPEDSQTLANYIRLKTLLIRDLAYSKID